MLVWDESQRMLDKTDSLRLFYEAHNTVCLAKINKLYERGLVSSRNSALVNMVEVMRPTIFPIERYANKMETDRSRGSNSNAHVF